MRYVLFTLLYAAPAIYCIADAVQDPEESPFGLHKVFWVVAFLLFPIVAPGAWILLKVRAREPRPRGRTVAPEDDPDYVRWLRERERRRREEQ